MGKARLFDAIEHKLVVTPAVRAVYITGLTSEDFSREGLARELGRSPNTINNQLAKVRQSVGAVSVAQLLHLSFMQFTDKQYAPRELNSDLRDITPLQRHDYEFSDEQVEAVTWAARLGSINDAAYTLSRNVRTVHDHLFDTYTELEIITPGNQALPIAYLAMRKLDLIV